MYTSEPGPSAGCEVHLGFVDFAAELTASFSTFSAYLRYTGMLCPSDDLFPIDEDGGDSITSRGTDFARDVVLGVAVEVDFVLERFLDFSATLMDLLELSVASHDWEMDRIRERTVVNPES